MPKPCGCTDLVYCDAHARGYNPFTNSLAEALRTAMFGGATRLFVFQDSSVWEIKSDTLAFSEADVAYLKKLRISPE